MNFARRELRQLKTEAGQIAMMAGLYYLLLIGLMAVGILKVTLCSNSAVYLEDALAGANLAAAVIDVEEYGATHDIRICEAGLAYRLFERALKQNLNLDEQWQCRQKAMISGQVLVESFVVYQVLDQQIKSYTVAGGGIFEETGKKGRVCTPGGELVTHSGIYSRISYDVEILPKITVRAMRQLFVDVVPNQ